ncbi:amidohydrolase [Chitinibacter sp. ZOR0017]|uniref:amidohydrolase n=1 Tax=Chitinibacter sp. ZOR0017 TaxID=1339254 RepID=UPI000AADD8BF|nr:amidohydrolase [Chitinibacter sp. ZOR0017]
MRTQFHSITLALTLAFGGGLAAAAPAKVADAIYYGGDIVTINDQQPTAEALAVKGGAILAVGSRAELGKLKGKQTKMINLHGQTLLPAFLDAHSHYINSLTVASQLNLYAPPAGPAKDVPSIVAELKKFAAEKKIKKGELIQAYGYDDTAMPEGRLLNRDDLDEALPNNPVIVHHVSMHGGVLNSLALKKFKINADTKTPEGGIIVRKEGTNEPYGLIMETAFISVFGQLSKPTTDKEIAAATRAGQMLFAQTGISTAHEGASHEGDIVVMQKAAKLGANIIDVIAFPFMTDMEKVLKTNPPATFGKYHNRFKLGGIKVTIDGSPQGRTAFFTTPYLNGGPGGEQDWKGEPTIPAELTNKVVKRVYDLGLPLNLHANGDAAIDQFIAAHEFAAAGSLDKDRRTTVIHSQFVRKDQLDKYAQYKIIPSMFTLHTFYFGEAHKANRGMEQASYISPMRDAIDRGITVTNHTDFVVAPLDQMFMLWSAVNRVSRGGEVFGAEQRVTPLEGLKAMTINVAYQYREEDNKGSLETGKLADWVILDQNPLKVEPMAIKDIKVVETIKEGKTIYRRA